MRSGKPISPPRRRPTKRNRITTKTKKPTKLKPSPRQEMLSQEEQRRKRMTTKTKTITKLKPSPRREMLCPFAKIVES